MPKVTQTHAYSDQKSFARLLILLATLIRYPGVGCPDPDALGEKIEHHNALTEVQKKWQQIATELDLNFKENYPAIATIRKDFSFLRKYGILEHRMYRWGYYLGTGVFSQSDLQLALNSMQAIAHDQGDFRYRKTLEKIQKYLRGFDFGTTDPNYPIRQNLNRPVNWTDPEHMMEKGEYRNTLFHHLEILETAIWQGQTLEISRDSSPYHNKHLGNQIIIPLQLIFYNVAWYLLYEDCRNKLLVIGRVNRFTNYCKIIQEQGRGLVAQQNSLEQAQKLLKNGWGLNLGNAHEQREELADKLDLMKIKARFFYPASRMIMEADQRHHTQRIHRSRKKSSNGYPEFIDYSVTLPPRSVSEFMNWATKYGGDVIFLEPTELVEKHQQNLKKLMERYQIKTENSSPH